MQRPRQKKTDVLKETNHGLRLLWILEENRLMLTLPVEKSV